MTRRTRTASSLSRARLTRLTAALAVAAVGSFGFAGTALADQPAADPDPGDATAAGAAGVPEEDPAGDADAAGDPAATDTGTPADATTGPAQPAQPTDPTAPTDGAAPVTDTPASPEPPGPTDGTDGTDGTDATDSADPTPASPPDDAVPSTAPAPKAAPKGTGKAVSPRGIIGGDFGTGKFNLVAMSPRSGTYPTGADLSGGAADLVDVTDAGAPVVVDSCVTDPTGLCADDFGPTQPGRSYEIRQTAAPAGFLADPDPVLVVPPAGSGCSPGGGLTCSIAVFDLVGVYRPVAVSLTDPLGAPLAGGVFALCRSGSAPVADDPCPSGSGQVATATTAADGGASFPGSYLPGQTMTVVQIAAPGAYLPAAPQSVTLDSVNSAAAAAVPVVASFADTAPVPPTAGDDTATVVSGSSVLVTVGVNDSGHGYPVLLGAASAPAHGTAQVVQTGDCRICFRYTSTAGYVGPDSFTYTLIGPGGTDTATVRITVTAPEVVAPVAAPPVAQGRPVATDGLAYTGVDVPSLALPALALVGVGGALAIGARRRTSA